jgi:hypothetical protein
MKHKYPILYTLTIVGIIIAIWGSIVYSSYPGMREIRKAAWHETRVQFIIGISLLIICYFLTFIKDKK